MHLTVEEKQVLEGKSGRLKQVALENVVRYAEILGADSLCRVTKATVFCGAHNYLEVCDGQHFHEVFSRMNLGLEETVPFTETDPGCFTQSCVSVCDAREYEALGQSKALFEKNAHFLEEARKAGVILAGSCAPYLTGWIPIRGEHFVTTESGVTAIGNSLWGAMGNSDGIEAAFWSAICGRTPLWGNHIEENRAATHEVRVENRVEDILDWDLLGAAVGEKLPGGSKPVIQGTLTGADFDKLRQFFTSLAVSSNCELCHIAGITPEARTVRDALRGGEPRSTIAVESGDLQTAYEKVCDREEGPLDLVSLGCPHYGIDGIKKVAALLESKKIHPDVQFMVWTVYPVKCMADANGFTKTVEDAGGRIYTGTCPTTIGKRLLAPLSGMLFDSFKQAGSVKSSSDARIYVAGIEACVEAAVTGRWEEKFRWENS